MSGPGDWQCSDAHVLVMCLGDLKSSLRLPHRLITHTVPASIPATTHHTHPPLLQHPRMVFFIEYLKPILTTLKPITRCMRAVNQGCGPPASHISCQIYFMTYLLPSLSLCVGVVIAAAAAAAVVRVAPVCSRLGR